jgi:hypothetical protein
MLGVSVGNIHLKFKRYGSHRSRVLPKTKHDIPENIIIYGSLKPV